jgi:hypothetical protein
VLIAIDPTSINSNNIKDDGAAAIGRALHNNSALRILQYAGLLETVPPVNAIGVANDQVL